MLPKRADGDEAGESSGGGTIEAPLKRQWTLVDASARAALVAPLPARNSYLGAQIARI